MKWLYLIFLLAGLSAMLLIDWRYRLALWVQTKRTLLTVAIGVGVFIVWDVLGITLGIFFSGDTLFMSGIYLGPEFPIEELLFLTFLCYFTLMIYLLGEKKWRRT